MVKVAKDARCDDIKLIGRFYDDENWSISSHFSEIFSAHFQRGQRVIIRKEHEEEQPVHFTDGQKELSLTRLHPRALKCLHPYPYALAFGAVCYQKARLD